MTAPGLISRDPAVVKAALVGAFADALDPLLHSAFHGTLGARKAEQSTWAVLLPIGALVLTALFAALCRRATESILEQRGRAPTARCACRRPRHGRRTGRW
jgi:hypothetical protein